MEHTSLSGMEPHYRLVAQSATKKRLAAQSKYPLTINGVAD
jgi:hypothetical protein